MRTTALENKAGALVEGVRAREERAMTTLYECVKRIVVRRFARVWPESWEDLLHDTYIEVLKNIDGLQNAAALFGFIQTIAIRLQNRYIGQAVRGRELLSSVAQELRSSDKTPFQVVLEREMWHRVNACLSRMTDRDRFLVKTVLDDRTPEWVQEQMPYLNTRQISLARSRAKLKLVERVARQVVNASVPCRFNSILRQPLATAA